ncbi:MAG TPA: HDOD domain-containing protein [Burkholderiaceae bacterium]|nr:HDOD domain-containing protein [Burkholderiaceae bacterium]
MPDADTRARPDPLEAMFTALREHGGLPSVGHALGRLARLLESDTEATHELANAILADVSLTQRLLRLANTISYRSGPQPVTTVTRAIVLLGFNQVRDVTMSLVLLDGVLAGADPARVRCEFHQALLAGCLARELLAATDSEEAEEAAIAAMFHNVGRLLVAVFAPEALARVRERAVHEHIGESSAAKRELGRSFDELTDHVLREWSLPERIMAAVAALPPRIDAPRTTAERVRVAAQFADAVAAALGEPNAETALAQTLERFAPAFAPDRAQLERMLEAASVRTREFEAACALGPTDSPLARLLDALPQESQLTAPAVEPSAQRDALGRPQNTQQILLAGLADASDSLARGTDLNAVIRIVLEAIHSGLGFARTALVMRDAASGLFRTRASFGDPRPNFSFPASGASHLFVAALAHATDLHIADVSADKVRAALPPWFNRDFAMTRSFVLLPLAVGGRAVGFFYADRPVADPHGLTPEELNLVRSLRNQVLLAMRAR